MTTDDIIILITGLVGTIGFSVLFGVKAKHLFFAALGGLIAGFVAVVLKETGTFISSTVAAFAATLYCEITARIKKAPVVTFLTPSIVVLVPGGALYYTVSNLILKDYSKTLSYGLSTIDACLGIAAGILVASLVVTIYFNLRNRISKHRQSHIERM